MIEEQGRVVALKGTEAWVQTLRRGACDTCKIRSGCGQRLLTELSGSEASQVQVENVLEARMGDQVVLGIGETALLRASLLVYLVPMLGLVLGALVADRVLGFEDAGTALFALISLLVAFFPVRFYQHRSTSGEFQPVLLRMLGATAPSEYGVEHRTHRQE